MRSQRDSADGLLSLARMERQDRIVAGTPAARDAGGRPAIGTSDLIGTAPWSDHDPYTDESLLDPWPGYKQMHDAGPAVWLPKYEMFALTRYDSVRRALRPVREEITAQAERVVQKLVAQGTFGAATDLANHLPVTVVSNPPRASFTRAERAGSQLLQR
jgi:hypothetical protein